MLRAVKIELVVIGRYLLQIFGLSLVVAGFLVAGLGSVTTVPAVTMCMMGMSGGLASAAYDEQGGWGAFRLAAALARRDVVIARFVSIALMVLIGAVTGLLVVGGLWGVSQVVELPAAVGSVLHIGGEELATLALSVAFCLMMVAAVTGIAIPIMFKRGSMAAQLAPVYFFLTVLGVGGILSFLGVDVGAALTTLKAWTEVPGNYALLFAGLVATTLVIWAVSIAVSIGLYARRDL